MKTLILTALLVCFCYYGMCQISSNSIYILLNKEKGMLKGIHNNGIITFGIPAINFKSGSLLFIYSKNPDEIMKSPTPIYEYNKIPESWERVNTKQILDFVRENMSNELFKKDIYIVERDKCLSTYIAYKVRWLNDANTD